MVAYCTNIDLFYKYAMKSWKISVKETNLVTFANEVNANFLITTVLQIKYFIEFKMKMSIKKNNLKLVSAIFYQISIFHWIAFQKLWKIFFISSKKLFSFSRYSNFCNPVFPSFFPVCHCFRGWSKKNLKVYDVINCLK